MIIPLQGLFGHHMGCATVCLFLTLTVPVISLQKTLLTGVFLHINEHHSLIVSSNSCLVTCVIYHFDYIMLSLVSVFDSNLHPFLPFPPYLFPVSFILSFLTSFSYYSFFIVFFFFAFTP